MTSALRCTYPVRLLSSPGSRRLAWLGLNPHVSKARSFAQRILIEVPVATAAIRHELSSSGTEYQSAGVTTSHGPPRSRNLSTRFSQVQPRNIPLTWCSPRRCQTSSAVAVEIGSAGSGGALPVCGSLASLLIVLDDEAEPAEAAVALGAEILTLDIGFHTIPNHSCSITILSGNCGSV